MGFSLLRSVGCLSARLLWLPSVAISWCGPSSHPNSRSKRVDYASVKDSYCWECARRFSGRNSRRRNSEADVVARRRHPSHVSNHHASPPIDPLSSVVLSDVERTPRFAVSTIPSIPSNPRTSTWVRDASDSSRRARRRLRGGRRATRPSRRRAPRKPNHDRSRDETTRVASVASVATATPNRDEETRRGCHRATRAPCRRFENVSQ